MTRLNFGMPRRIPTSIEATATQLLDKVDITGLFPAGTRVYLTDVGTDAPARLIAAAGLDVLPEEPASLDDPLVRAFAEQPDWIRDRLVLTPHAAFNSPDGRRDARANATRTLMRYLRTGELWNCVNGAFLPR